MPDRTIPVLVNTRELAILIEYQQLDPGDKHHIWIELLRTSFESMTCKRAGLKPNHLTLLDGGVKDSIDQQP